MKIDKVYQKYRYTGPQWYFGHKIAEKSNMFTMATSFQIAKRNFLYKVANGDQMLHYDIDDRFISIVKSNKIKQLVVKTEEPEIQKCEYCGYQLNDLGHCPVCDCGEDDLLQD